MSYYRTRIEKFCVFSSTSSSCFVVVLVIQVVILKIKDSRAHNKHIFHVIHRLEPNFTLLLFIPAYEIYLLTVSGGNVFTL